jgi:2-polyprenyl-3-methyl-5-hydroxy-6-metoxy-1,4-benzoquinol methylase
MSISPAMNDDLIRTHSQSDDQDFRRAALWQWVQRHLVRGRAIDVGGGSGYMTRRLLEAGYQTVLAEPDAELYDFSRASLGGGTQNLTVIRESAEQLDPARIGTFENVLCFDVLEHIEDDHAAIRNIARLVPANGQMIISVPALPALYGKRDVAYGHYRRHTKASLRALIEGAGLQVETLQFWNMVGVPVYFAFEKVLKRPINDQLRREKGGALSGLVRSGLYRWLTLETRLPMPLGLSLLAVARPSR